MISLDLVSMTGFKLSDRIVKLGRMNLLLGPVGSGKSQVVDAIQFAALGCVPRVGKNTAQTLKLLNGSEGRVSLGFSDERSAERSLVRSGAGGKGSASASWLPMNATTTENAKAIMGRFGASEEDAAENLDIMRLLQRSNSDLARVIEELLEGGGIDADERVSQSIQVWRARLESGRKTVDGLLQPVDPAILKIFEIEIPELEARIRKNLVTALEWVGQRKRDCAKTLDGKIKARGELEDRVAQLNAPAGSAESLARDDAELFKEYSETHQRITLARKANVERDAAAAAAVEAEVRLIEAKDRRDKVLNNGQNSDKMREHANENFVEPPEIEPFQSEHCTKFQEWIDIHNEIDAIPPYVGPEAPKLEKVPEAVDNKMAWFARSQARSALTAAEESPWVEIIRALDQIEACEFSCVAGSLQMNGHWQKVRLLAEKHSPDLALLTKTYNDASHDYDRATADKESREKEIQEVVSRNEALSLAYEEAKAKALAADRANADRRIELRKRADAIQAATAAKNDQGRAEWKKRKEARDLEIDRVRSARAALLKEAENRDETLRSLHREVVDAQARLDSAKSRVEGVTSALSVDIDADLKRMSEIEKARSEIQRDLDLAKRAEAARDEMRSMIREIDRLTAEREVHTAAEWALKRVRDDDMRKRSEGFQGQLAKFLRAAGRTETPYMRCSKGQAEFGWTTDDGKDIAIEVLSGGQSVIYKAALGYAILMARNPPVKILNIELAEAADGKTAQALLNACGSICDQVQVVVASCVPVEAPSESWTIIDLHSENGTA